MNNRAITIIIFTLISFCQILYAQDIEWERSFGGTGTEYVFGCNAQEVPSGGYIVNGTSSSTDGETEAMFGGIDHWIAKLAEDGTTEWTQVYGGSENESFFNYISPTSDGGYIFSGNSKSSDGAISGNNGGHDVWVAKLSSEGEIEWEENYGGSKDDSPYSISETNDGGYIVCGTSESDDIDVSNNYGGWDFWLLKLSNDGAIEWEKNYGGSGDDIYPFLELTDDGGYLISGISDSNDGDVSNNYGGNDVWIVKLSSEGEIEWDKNYGGTGNEITSFVAKTDDGYIMTSATFSDDGDVSSNFGGSDLWVAKLSSQGDIEWEHSYGGIGSENWFSFVQQTFDGGFILTGTTASSGEDIATNYGEDDYWLVKLSNDGDIEWEQNYGGSGDDRLFSISPQTSDGGFLLSGSTNSNDGDVSSNNGSFDFWIVKVHAQSSSIYNNESAEIIDLYPNPTCEKVKIINDKFVSNSKFEIYDVLGTLVSNGSMTNNEIDMASLRKGTYSLVIHSEEQIYNCKVIKH